MTADTPALRDELDDYLAERLRDPEFARDVRQGYRVGCAIPRPPVTPPAEQSANESGVIVVIADLRVRLAAHRATSALHLGQQGADLRPVRLLIGELVEPAGHRPGSVHWRRCMAAMTSPGAMSRR